MQKNDEKDFNRWWNTLLTALAALLIAIAALVVAILK